MPDPRQQGPGNAPRRKPRSRANPTAVQSGNRQATLRLGGGRGGTVATNRLYRGAAARRSPVLNGPRRAQAREQVANRIGPTPAKPRAVTSRVTSRGFGAFL